jgi:hypothetical protein
MEKKYDTITEMEETYISVDEEKDFTWFINLGRKLPADTPVYDNNVYCGTIPPTLVKWISKAVRGGHDKEATDMQYRIFKNTKGDYSLQELTTSVNSTTLASGDLASLIGLHNTYTTAPPRFIRSEDDIQPQKSGKLRYGA